MKRNKFRLILYLFLMIGVAGVSCRYVFKINGDIKDITEHPLMDNFKEMLKVTPSVYSFEYVGSSPKSTIQLLLSEIKKTFGNKIVQIESAREYTELIPAGSDIRHSYFLPLQSTPKYDESANYFGMHVEDAWHKGYNGSGIKVAVVDIGVNTKVVDLKRNLDMGLEYNFMSKTSNATPEDIIHSYRAESIRKLDHGNRCASIIAAEKGNNLCNAGIAFDAKIVPLKIFSLSHEYGMFKIHSTSDATAAALAYQTADIHIYSNSWSPKRKFEPLDLAMREAIRYGATVGRDKLGVIYVVPDGSEGITGSGLANSLYTITVNSVGVGGTLPSRPEVSACVITSGLSDGNKLHTKFMMTSSYNNACVESFKGVSAAVAQVSGIIALILQARPDLTIRDIQLLLAESSDREGLAESNNFNRNGVGKYFHHVLGYGLVNADKAVSLAKTWRPVGKLYKETFEQFQAAVTIRLHHHQYSGEKWMTIIRFEMTEDPCRPQVNTIEQVMVRIGYDVIKREGVRIEIVSPSETASIIVDNENVANIDDTDTSHRTLISTHFIGESPIGNWSVRIQFDRQLASKHLRESTSLTIFGTNNGFKRQNNSSNCPSSTDDPTLHENTTMKSRKGNTNDKGTTKDTKHAETGGNITTPSLKQLILCVSIGVIVKIFNTHSFGF